MEALFQMIGYFPELRIPFNRFISGPATILATELMTIGGQGSDWAPDLMELIRSNVLSQVRGEKLSNLGATSGPEASPHFKDST